MTDDITLRDIIAAAAELAASRGAYITDEELSLCVVKAFRLAELVKAANV